jgi:hypothetical protein
MEDPTLCAWGCQAWILVIHKFKEFDVLFSIEIGFCAELSIFFSKAMEFFLNSLMIFIDSFLVSILFVLTAIHNKIASLKNDTRYDCGESRPENFVIYLHGRIESSNLDKQRLLSRRMKIYRPT